MIFFTAGVEGQAQADSGRFPLERTASQNGAAVHYTMVVIQTAPDAAFGVRSLEFGGAVGRSATGPPKVIY